MTRWVVVLTVWVAGIASSTVSAQDWVEFTDETATRLVADPSVGANDNQEKDYAWGDVDNDGDIDLVCVRKQPFTTPGRRPNLLLINEGIAEGHPVNGVLVDRTLEYATDADDGGNGFLDLTNDRDVVLADLNGDGWLDIVTAVTLSDGLAKTISHPRIYINLGANAGVWQGFRYEQNRTPQIVTIGTNTPVAPRHCSVAFGDIDDDGDIDLYFGDYDSGGVGGGNPEDPGEDVDDRLWLNDGNGFFTDTFETRMDSEMLLSAFSMASVFADMNGDGAIDLVKDTALQFPQRVSISYNNPSNEGFFDQFDEVDNAAPYHISVGDLNRDNRLDIVVTDDGADHYWLNQGNGADGMANFTRTNFQRSSGGDGEFGGNSVIADLNNDDNNDVLIADVDVDIDQNCSRRLHIYRNLGNLPNVTLQEQGGNRPWTHNGTHDVAVFDINGDGWLDMVVGHCTGTNVWINLPPTNIVFGYPQGLPGDLIPGSQTQFEVAITSMGAPPAPGTGKQFVSIDGGPFVETAMPEGPTNTYAATLPPVPCTSTASYYFSVETTGGQTVTDPPNAPTGVYTALSSLGEDVLSAENFEEPDPDWVVTSDASLTSGAWERVDPLGTFFPDGSVTPAQPDSDFGAAAQDTECYITQQYSGTGTAGNNDVDGGPTILTSPVYDLAGSDAIVTYARWFFCNDEGTANEDRLITEITNGASGWIFVQETTGTGGSWEAASFRVSDYVAPTANVQIRFVAADSPNNSVTEAGIDNVTLTQLICDSCIDASDCDDGIACNGVESCSNGNCVPGVPLCDGATPYCDEVNDTCVECLNSGHCDDGLFCNGLEVCVDGVCVQGTPPCEVAELLCDEVNDVCLGCIDDGDCDDGNICNGIERCDGMGNCVLDTTGFENGTFDGSAGWSTTDLNGGNMTFAGQLEVTGTNDGAGAFTWSAQMNVDVGNDPIEFDLISYTSTDTGAFDRPVFFLNGTFYGLDSDGTLGQESTGTAANVGNINNDNQVNTPIHFVVDVAAIAGPGRHTIGFGTLSVDGDFGAGVSVFDNILPVEVAADPCPGLLCNASTQECVECLTDADCDDGVYCNGQERCVNGVCVPGVPPCDVGTCDEVNDTCPIVLQPAMGEPLLGLSQPEEDRFNIGLNRFDRVFTEVDGLGPAFNQNSCTSCHNTGGAGGSGTIAVTRFGLATKAGFDSLEMLGGSLFQLNGISPECSEQIPAEANVIIQRTTPSIFGAGLVEAIADADLLANETSPPDANVSGRAHMVPLLEGPAGLHVGRFGWKAQLASILSFSADASLFEMGLTNRILQDEVDPNGAAPPNLIDCDGVADPEDGPEGGVPGNPHFIDRVTDFQRLLAAPPQTPRDGMSGEALFNSFGCAACHVSTWTTGAAAESAIAFKTIKPYSDFLLHDMGGLGDGIVQGDATTTEMRTPSLWGMRIRPVLLHDGRASAGVFADRVREAVEWHDLPGSEAQVSAQAYLSASASDQAAVVAFLDSLGRREFDHDGNNIVGSFDLAVFRTCQGGGPYSPDDPCAISDVDQDGDVDDDDFALFLTVYQGSQDDCNGNLVSDAIDIVDGTANDCNLNGIPDSCEGSFDVLATFINQLLIDDVVPACPLYDANNDGKLNGADIQPFVSNLINP